jgi:hypothetical protein
VVGLLGVLLLLNGSYPVIGKPHEKHDKLHAVEHSLTFMHRWEVHKIARCPIE